MRAFIALELPPALQSELLTLRTELASALDAPARARALHWTPAANIHLTLRFLGETSPAQHAAIVEQMRALAATTPAIDIVLRGLGCFPSFRRPSIVWLGAEGASAGAPFAALQQAIERIAVGEGFSAEARAYTAHLTLARLERNMRPGERTRIGELLEDAAQTPHLDAWRRPVHVDHISFMQSELRPQGAIYTALDRLALGQADYGR